MVLGVGVRLSLVCLFVVLASYAIWSILQIATLSDLARIFLFGFFTFYGFLHCC